MFKLSALVVLVAAIACSVAEAKPGVVVGAAAVPAGVVTATSSQYVARNFNGVAAAPIVAPVAAAYTAPVAAAYTAPAAAYTSPVAAAYTSPVAAAYTAPVAAAYSAYPYSAYPYASYPYAAGYTTVL
ncbi:LOW QUALITY PROTEIN: vitelline membrane protein Vm26Ab [Drosophila subobscura]|uniref:LOW QUALITY PROTEIN: vitelline membrane protein Vm26Ab n=1 Tax=Drosophila subobscura TaxID=7241 RepID=UPI00155AFE01|nr:LOW QUALITY PROTEIN: vitelline membrane protein Vm26Ab [Drosophila subobscura]